MSAHWESVYAAKPDADPSWFQASPDMSLRLLIELDPEPKHVLDVGGGQSSLAGSLSEAGVERVTVLDVSPSAVERGKVRAGAAAR